ncbi:YveK family protein [Lactiplantibacillus xiangfangensis]|uniref:Capsular polysaccharide biosynthesis protein CpsC n=1 Tax=Lactiplantibacillus xiangfangensis TaxID=942150 RepID=A0A0R2M1G7_9LACO|nr:Wzz/FepE/Etk N-terminal domain-containing protein [Lactiplantibacillus xiangfangensis]KRO07919.1 exopolysaccharide biosynthesis protein [Lactiplantibacillus xiangfangensis]
MDQAVNFDFLLRLLRKYWRAIVGFTLAGVIIAAGVVFLIVTPKYESDVQILVNRKNTNAATEYAGQQADVQMITTYKDLITNQVVLSPARKQLKKNYHIKRSLATLKREVNVVTTANSQVFSISVRDTDALASAIIANQVARSFKRQVKKIIRVNNVTLVAPAEMPKHPVAPKKALDVMIGLLAGVLLGLLYALLRTLTDRRVHELTFLTDDLGLTNLGMVSHQRHTTTNQAVAEDGLRRSAKRV